MTENKVEKQYTEAFNNFQTDFIKLVKKYQRIYNLPIKVSLSLNASLPIIQDPTASFYTRSHEMWCDKKLTMEKDEK